MNFSLLKFICLTSKKAMMEEKMVWLGCAGTVMLGGLILHWREWEPPRARWTGLGEASALAPVREPPMLFNQIKPVRLGRPLHVPDLLVKTGHSAQKQTCLNAQNWVCHLTFTFYLSVRGHAHTEGHVFTHVGFLHIRPCHLLTDNFTSSSQFGYHYFLLPNFPG